MFMSPGVYSREVDLTTTIPAVSTNISVLVIREPWKGSEFEQHFISNDDILKSLTGTPTSKSYRDILAAFGFLKYGSMLYTTIVRPDDATFAGKKILDGYNETGNDFVESFTYTATGSVDSDEPDGPYDYKSLGIADLSAFPEAVENEILTESNSILWFISSWRNENSNRVRVLTFDRDMFQSAIYYDEDSEDFDFPAGVSPSTEAQTAITDMKNNNIVAYNSIRGATISLSNDYQFGIIVQAKNQGASMWTTEEEFVVSTDDTDKDDTGTSLFVEDVINNQSRYVRVALNPSYRTTDEVDNGPVNFGTKDFQQLTGGKNGYWGRHSNVDYAEGEDAAVIMGYNMYSNPEEIDVNLFIDADKSVTVKKELIEIAQVKRKDSMVVLDVPRELVLNNKGQEALDLVRWRKGQGTSTFNPNTSYASLYANWVEVFDKWNKKYRWVPASGHVSGLYANTDQQADPWFAAAGLNRAILTGIRRLAWNPNQGERDLLYKNGLNPMVSFSGQGKVVWGQKTLLDKPSAFDRVNVRRLFLVLQKAISKASKYFLFEQNDEITWMQMTNMIEPFLRDVQGRRGIFDFKVQIDEVTNTPVRIDRNELWGRIFIKPTRVAEFIILEYIATPTGASFEEIIGG